MPNNQLTSIKAIINQAQLFIKNKMDQHVGYLTPPNGLINLRNGEIRAFQAEDFITQTLSVSYDQNIDTKVIDDFVFEILGNNQGNYEYLRWIIGYAIQGNPKHKLLVHLYGPNGNNGKSLFLKVLKQSLGFYSCDMSTDLFKDTKVVPNPALLAVKSRRQSFQKHQQE